MVLLTSHKILLAFTAIGLILAIAVFVSPGWFRVHYYVHEAVPFDHAFPQPDEGRTDGPVAMAKRSVDEDKHHKHHHKHHHHGHHGDEMMTPGTKKVHISCGLWYFSTCVCGMDLDGKKIKKCHYSSYCKAKKNAYNLPPEFEGAGLEKVYTNIGEVAKYALMEFQIEGTAAIICLVIATLSAIRYLRSNAHKRCSGLTTVITHIMAGVLLAVVVGKFTTMFIQAKIMLSHYEFNLNNTHFHVPYCLIIAGISAIATLVSSFALLVILSKGARPNVEAITSSGKRPGRPFGVISPTGYQPFHGLVEPPPYKKDLSVDEQAEELPKKEAM